MFSFFKRKKMIWRDLLVDPPTGSEEMVILFPSISDVGIMYTASNPFYAKSNAINNGYTHWMELDKAPTHDMVEEYIKKNIRDK